MTRAALITGASRGLGRAIAEELAHRGWAHLGLGCREIRQPTELPTPDSGKTKYLFLSGDLADPQVPDRIVRDFLSFSGNRLDLLVNNAGVFLPSLLLNYEEVEWDRQVSVNLSAPFRLMRAAAAALAASRGAVVNISSMVGFRGGHGAAAYSAAKCGLEALTRAAAVEWGNAGVRVNAVIPGFLADTDMGRASLPGYVQSVLAVSPLGRAADVASAARLIADLADMPAVTGQVLSLEGRCGSACLPAIQEP